MTGFALILGKAFGEFTDISEDSFGFVVFWNLCDLIETDEAHFGRKLFSLDSFNQMINQNKMDI